MSRHTFCTYFDRNYLLRGMVMLEHLRKHAGTEARIAVICMDELTRTLLRKIYGSSLELIPFHEVEAQDADLLKVRASRTALEYLWTTTPIQILHAMRRFPDSATVTYLDADLMFFSSPQVVIDELGSGAVLIHKHNFPPRLAGLAEHGIYNVGLVTANCTREGSEIISWWRERCLEWCGATKKNGMLGDQGYLNDWPARFPGTVVTKNIGVGVAPWNQEQYCISKGDDGTVRCDGVPVVFYHFHSFAMANPHLCLASTETTYTPGYTEAVLREFLAPYLDAIHRALSRVQQELPSFTFGTCRSGLSATTGHVLIGAPELEPQLRKAGLTQRPVPLSPNWMGFIP